MILVENIVGEGFLDAEKMADVLDIGRQCPQYGERGHSAAGSTQMTTKS